MQFVSFVKMAKPTELTAQNFRDDMANVLDRASLRGERFIVTKHGKPCAALVPLEDLAQLEGKTSESKPATHRQK